MWSWRRLLRVTWTTPRSNQSILKEINPEYSLEGLMLKLKFQYFGHLMWRANSLEKTLVLRKIEGRRRRGWQRMRWWLNGKEFEQTPGDRWRTGKPGVLQSMRLPRVRYNLATEQLSLLTWIYYSGKLFPRNLKTITVLFISETLKNLKQMTDLKIQSNNFQDFEYLPKSSQGVGDIGLLYPPILNYYMMTFTQFLSSSPHTERSALNQTSKSVSGACTLHPTENNQGSTSVTTVGGEFSFVLNIFCLFCLFLVGWCFQGISI